MAANAEPRWLRRDEVDIIHLDLIRRYGGQAGLRDDNMVESALNRPRQKWHYEAASLAALAAAYAYGLARNHGYLDGNKRIALAAMTVFLLHNGHELDAPPDEAARVLEDVAAGRFTEADLTEWVEHNLIDAG